MRRTHARGFLLFTLVLLATAGCEVSSEGPRDRPEGTQAMMANDEATSIAQGVRQRVTAILQSGQQAAATLPELYTPDAVLSDESETTYAGHAQVASAFAQGMPPGATIDMRSSGAIGSGDLVVDMGNYTVRMPNPQGGAPVSMNGRYLVVLQRMDDGSWKIVRQLTDAVGMGGALPAGPPQPVDTADSAATAGGASPVAPPPAETGFTPSP